MAQNNLTSNPVVNEAIDAGHSLGSFLTSWYHSPELQEQYHGDINVALQASGFDTHAPNFVNEFRDASELATHNTASSSFEGTHQTAIDNQAAPMTNNVQVPAAPAPALLSTPAPVFVAPESHGDPVAQQLQAISNNYVSYQTSVDSRQFQTNVDNSHTNNFDTQGGNVHFNDNSSTNTNTVNGDHAFGATDVHGGIHGVATGDGAVAGGHDAIGATGDHSIAGEHLGVANTGDGAVVGEHVGAANTGTFNGTQVGGPVDHSNLQTITGEVHGIAAQDTSFHGPVNTGDADHGGVVNNGIHGDANTLTGGVGSHSNVNLGGDQHVLQGDGNVGVAQGDHANVDQSHSSIATNGSESGPAIDGSHGGSVAFGAGATSANANIDGGHGPVNLNQFGQQAISDHGPAQIAGHDLVNQTADGAHGPVAFGGGDAIDAAHNHGALSFGGDATNADHGGIANHDGLVSNADHGGTSNLAGGDQAVAQDHSAASLHGDATAQNVDHLHDSSVSFGGDSQNFSHTDHTAGSIGGDALNQDHNHDTAGVAGHGDALVDNSDHSQVDDHSQHDYSSHYTDSYNTDHSYNTDDHSDHIHDSYNDDSHDHHVDIDTHHSDVDIHHA